MAIRNSKMRTHKRKRSIPKRSAFGRAIKDEGRSAAWLSTRTGYSVAHIWRVARGEHRGSLRFHAAMQTALGREY